MRPWARGRGRGGPGRTALAALLLVAAGCGRERAERRASEARAAACVDSVALAYGGMPAFDALHYVRFDLSVRDEGKVLCRARHLWDLQSGICRVDLDLESLAGPLFLTGEDSAAVALPPGRLEAVINRRTGEGRVQVERAALDGEAKPLPSDQVLLDLVRRRLEGDGLWLLLPFRLREPGWRLADLGLSTSTDAKGPAREIEVTFERAAREIPCRRCRLFVSPETHRLLESEIEWPGTSPVVRAVWRGEVTLGGVRVAAQRDLGRRALVFDLLAAPMRMAPEVFTDLQRPMPY